ncbi:MAG TPA: hypothetical protein DHV28_00770 [Ignavibacteriales bacterium]|nr:hypothetical protein [Ignavibacteriales bacterium]
MKFFLLIGIAALILNSCSSGNITTDLSGKGWDVTSMLGKNFNSGSTKSGIPSLIFEKNGKLFGSTGCNNFTGSYKITDKSIMLDLGSMTKMFCPESTEQDFLKAVKQVTGFNFDGGNLNLQNGSKTVMSLQRREN